MMNRSQIEKMLMASGGITGEPVQTARIGSYMTSTGGGKKSNTVTQRTTSGGGSTTQRKTTGSIKQGNAERQLNNLVNKARNDRQYANVQGAGMNYGTAYDLAPQAAKDFVNRQLEKTGGRLNEAAKARLNSYLTDRTQYQLDLDKFRKASPENEAAYVKRFPKTAAFEKALRRGAEGLIGTPGRIIKNLADNYLDGVKNMVEKISGVDAKNIDIAKDKDADIDTIVNNLQRNIKEEREDGKARGMSEADLTAMYGDPIDIATGDDIFGAELIGMDELEEDSPLRAEDVAPDAVPLSDIVGGSSEINQRRDELSRGKDVAPGFPKADDAPGLDLTAPADSVDLSGTSGRITDDAVATAEQEFQDTYGFDSENYQTALEAEKKEIEDKLARGESVIDKDRDTPGTQGFLEARKTDFERLPSFYKDFDREGVVRNIQSQLTGSDRFNINRELPLSGRRSFIFGDKTFPVTERIETDYGTPDVVGSYDTFQDPETLGPETVPGSFLDAPFEFLPLYSGPLDFNFSPEPRREPETFNTALDELANNTRADGGQIFGNQNMSTFDKLKAIADGIADNK